ncbi:hypothetical protein [uncultured Thiodictyon sp.]|uniref:hypothetical protein n=1 Tax=uncultured Thiodictyon sp. TaxID=1846217 RepID=UPI0025CC4C89|nr:hypothetical protein [uncultured Thiodictyon sp.]
MSALVWAANPARSHRVLNPGVVHGCARYAASTRSDRVDPMRDALDQLRLAAHLLTPADR